ncbi:MAG TPA: AMP-dependent synthetase/ligase [Kineosporiaceae bacterium]|nr:AMP-dependent synthetase/ligase [Kineosporiaceae bacterium]
MDQAELPRTVAEFAFLLAERFGDRPAQRFKRDGRWLDISYVQLRDVSAEVGRGLIALGVRPGERVCVLSDTRPEWTHVQFGISAAGALVVPIYPSSSPEECEWVIGNSGAVVVICEDAAQLDKVDQIRDRLPELRHVVTIEPTGGKALTLEELRQRGEGEAPELERRTDAVQPDDPALIVYTSGTTGPPKGCLLTHRNLTACCRVTRELDVLRPGDVSYLFLPLAHVFAQVVQLSTFSVGGVAAYGTGNPATIVSECAEVQATCMPSVPRIFEKVHGMFSDQSPADPRVSAKLRAVFGGRLRVAISGAAPIAQEILEFFHAAGVPVYEGYGMSESSSVGTLNTVAALKIGSIGRPVPGCEVRIADDGEIMMRGPHIFAGYWDNPEATREVLVDGWLSTGDLGAIDEAGFVTITGRKKDIIITAGGKNITPANIENDLRQSPWISQVLLYGDRRPFLVALITLDPDQIVPWARAQGLPADIAGLQAHPSVRELIQGMVDQANARYARVEQIKRFAVLERDFTVETGELTPTLKMKRRVVEQNYTGVLERLYRPA